MRSLVVLLALTHLAAAQSPPTAASVLADVQKFYANTQQLDAKFRQTVTQTVFGKTTNSDGELWIAKPASFRADYVGRLAGRNATVKSFMYDGKTFRYVDHVNKRITTQQVQTSALPAAVSFLTNAAALAKQFTARIDSSSTYGGKDDTVLELVPKQPSAQYKQLFLVVANSDGHVRGSIVIDANGDTNAFSFFAPDLASKRAASWFQVGTLPGYAP